MDLCIHDCEMSGQLRASESFFSYFRVEIVGPIFQSYKNLKQKACHLSAKTFRIFQKNMFTLTFPREIHFHDPKIILNLSDYVS